MTTTDLHTKYRPKSFDEVYGHKAVIKSLKSVIERKSTHALLFSGASGTGKTTLARIFASEIGCDLNSVMEIDAATHTSIDDMREITKRMNFNPIMSIGATVCIVDECHGLSKQAWNSLLKSIEEPSEHFYWVFLSTDPHKIPEAIMTRCSHFKLNLIDDDVIEELVEEIIEKEKLDLDDAVIRAVVKNAAGSPRRALVNLNLCAECDDVSQAFELMKYGGEAKEVIDICRFLASGCKGGWKEAMRLVKGVSDVDQEGVRRTVLAYFTQVTLGTTSSEKAGSSLHIMDVFSEPWYNASGVSHLILAIGQVMFGE
tara:strand:- start:1482 stop:2423 length:942 start_codon:yes stop_codon:yes gene_type:complete